MLQNKNCNYIWLCFRKEPLNMRSIVGIIKVVGALVCVGGTIIISLYKGKVLHLWPTNIIGYHPSKAATAFGHHHIRGTILLAISCLSLAVWYTVQVSNSVTTYEGINFDIIIFFYYLLFYYIYFLWFLSI